jgi:arsenate reductase
VEQSGEGNPKYAVSFSENANPLIMFSKLYDDASSAQSNFAAVMTCSHADENCPFIPGANNRIPVRYEDPKAFDDTELESAKYDERSKEIATEMFYVFSQVR